MVKKRKRPVSLRKYANGPYPWYKKRSWSPAAWIAAVKRRQRAEAKELSREKEDQNIRRPIGR